MPAMTAAHAAAHGDDFDMARLQKSLKQRQRHARRNSANVAKLTPAEIRSLNNKALESTTGSQSSANSISPVKSRRGTTTTPPTTPDKVSAYQAQSHRNSVSRNSTVDVPTPPHTPNGHRRPSQSSTRSQSHGHRSDQPHGNGTIHAPRPKGSTHAAFVAANGLSPRPSSSGSSTYRGLQTYRGPEVTRNGSFNMLQRPSSNIVTNPLSYFSRPRQSTLSTSPERSHNSGEVSIYRAQSLRNERDSSISNISATSSRPSSPHRLTDSPVSMMHDTEKFTVLNPADDPHNQPKVATDDEIPAVVGKPVNAAQDQNEAFPSLPVENAVDQADTPRKENKKRFTIFGPEKGIQDGTDSTNKLKKLRRRSLPLTESHQPKTSEPEQVLSEGQTAAPKEDLHVDGAKIEECDFAAHPAVRPLSLVIPDEFKGKEREIDCGPVYARCSCCGRLKRPPGASELSPVMENENLRTNFSFEIERTSSKSVRRSSDSSRGKFTPIIPMAVGENETRQASIEPFKTPTEPTSHQRQGPSPGPSSRKMNRQVASPPKFVRFVSLHGRRNGDPAVINEEDELEMVEDAPMLSKQRTVHFAEVQTHDFGALEEIAESQPLPENLTTKMTAGQNLDDQHTDIKSTPEESPNTESESDTFFTPLNGATPVIEKLFPETQEHSKPATDNQGRFLLTLPQPSFGPQFTRSSDSLRDLVLRSGSVRLADERENLQKLSKQVSRGNAVSTRVDAELLGH
ncbi:hypothetical protein LTR13_003634 [Exophiala sideris]|nr:hypothetical protein LTR13_003634 [Exophiala sideris]